MATNNPLDPYARSQPKAFRDSPQENALDSVIQPGYQLPYPGVGTAGADAPIHMSSTGDDAQRTAPKGPDVREMRDVGTLPATNYMNLPGGTAGPGPQAPVGPTAGSYQTRLMEGDTGKLANAAHAAKSPKYDFLQLAQQNKYGYDQLPQMLAALQAGPNAAHWQGWTADKDKLRYGGDPSALGAAWNGVTTVDAIGGFNSGNPQGWRWGADDAGTMAAAQGGGGMLPGGGMPFGTPQAMDPLQQLGHQRYSADIMQYLAQQLGLSQVLGGGR